MPCITPRMQRLLITVILALVGTAGLVAALSWNQYQPVEKGGSRIIVEGTSTLRLDLGDQRH